MIVGWQKTVQDDRVDNPSTNISKVMLKVEVHVSNIEWLQILNMKIWLVGEINEEDRKSRKKKTEEDKQKKKKR